MEVADVAMKDGCISQAAKRELYETWPNSADNWGLFGKYSVEKLPNPGNWIRSITSDEDYPGNSIRNTKFGPCGEKVIWGGLLIQEETEVDIRKHKGGEMES